MHVVTIASSYVSFFRGRGSMEMLRRNVQNILIAAVLFIPTCLFGQIQVWNGTVSSNWSEVANWNTFSVPSTGDQIQVSGSGSFECIADDIGYLEVSEVKVVGRELILRGNTYLKNNAVVRDFHISGGGTVTIEAGATAEHTRWTRIGRVTAGTMNVYGTFLTGTERFDVGFDGAVGSALNIYEGGLVQADGGAVFDVYEGSVINMYGGTLKKAGDQVSTFGALINTGKIYFPHPGADYTLTYEADGYTYLTVTILPADTSKAHWPHPQDGANLSLGDTEISWTPGDDVLSQDVYICDDLDEINAADPGSACYRGNYPSAQMTLNVSALDSGKKYYWRVDTNKSSGTVPGDVWSFNKIKGEFYGMDYSGGFPVDYVTVQSLQGLVNRAGARLYTYKWDTDFYWLGKMPELAFLEPTVLGDNAEVFTIPEFAGVTDTMVVYDRDDCRAAVLVALTAAGILDSLAVENDDIAYMQGLGYSIHTDSRADLRGRWSSNETAITWAYNNLRGDCIDSMAGIDPVEGALIKGADLFVQNKMFVFPLDAHGVNINYQTNIQDQILSTYPAGSKVHGWWSKEVRDVHYLSEFGLTVGQVAPNTSFFSKLDKPAEPLVQNLSREKVVYNPSKTYVTISFSQGDSLHFCQKENLTQMTNASSIEPGKAVAERYAFGQMHSTFQWDLQPLVVKHLYDIKPDHMLFTAKGYGYTNPTIQWQNGFMNQHCNDSLYYMDKVGVIDYMLNDSEATDVANYESIRKICRKVHPRSIVYKGQLDESDDEDDSPMVIEGVPVFPDPVFGVEDEFSNFYVQDTIDAMVASANKRQFYWVFLKHSTNEQEVELLFEALQGYPQFEILDFNTFIEFYRERAGVKYGDFDNDGNVDADDVTRLAGCWGTSLGDADYDPVCDISYPRGNRVDWADFVKMADSWMK